VDVRAFFATKITGKHGGWPADGRSESKTMDAGWQSYFPGNSGEVSSLSMRWFYRLLVLIVMLRAAVYIP